MTDATATLHALRRHGLYRHRRVIESAQGPTVMLGGREVLLLCSNDYLGLAGHPALRAAAACAALTWGAGAGASPLVSGHTELHRELETELAAFKGSEACVLFGSGFLANTGVIATLAGPGDVILSDALNHASLIDGCRLARARTVIYPHCDMEALAAELAMVRDGRSVIVTESVFSMDGDIAPLAEIAALARRHGARMVVDEAHATGVVGPAGRGLVVELGLERQVDVVVGTLGKALGSYGAFACCDAATAELLINCARTMIFSTALPPAAIGAALHAIQRLRSATELVSCLHARAREMRTRLRDHGIPVPPGPTPIVPLIVGDARAATVASEQALREGVFVQAIRPPTVPPGTSRLRIVVTAAHAGDELARAAACLARATGAVRDNGGAS